MPNGKVINTETNEEEDYSADFSYDYATGTIVPEVPGGDNEISILERDQPSLPPSYNASRVRLKFESGQTETNAEQIQ